MSKGLKGKNHGNNQWTLPVEVQHRRQIFLMVFSGHFQQVSREFVHTGSEFLS